MTYLSQDLNILDEMIQDRAKNELIEYSNGKRKVILAETDGTNYSVTVIQVPEDTIVIKSDYFEAPQNFFQSKKGECKRSDFIMISNYNKKKFIIFIEMKQTRAPEKEIIQQFKGSECLIAYCQKIGQLF
ncbi:MAG: hypothetical protein AAGA60_23740 [Cyanobacteria bacterium P01_E01_bin.42]